MPGLKWNNVTKSGTFMAKSGNFFILFLHFARCNNSEDMKNKTKFRQKSTVKTQNQSALATKRLRDKKIIFCEKKYCKMAK